MENTRELIHNNPREETPEIEHSDTNDIGLRNNEYATLDKSSCLKEMTVPLSAATSGTC